MHGGGRPGGVVGPGQHGGGPSLPRQNQVWSSLASLYYKLENYHAVNKDAIPSRLLI